MTDIEKKALKVENEVRFEHGYPPVTTITNCLSDKILCRAIEQHEAFKQEVSDAVEEFMPGTKNLAAYFNYVSHFARFIIAKPDPLVKAMRDACEAQGLATKHTPVELAEHLRASLAARGLKIVDINA